MSIEAEMELQKAVANLNRLVCCSTCTGAISLKDMPNMIACNCWRPNPIFPAGYHCPQWHRRQGPIEEAFSRDINCKVMDMRAVHRSGVERQKRMAECLGRSMQAAKKVNHHKDNGPHKTSGISFFSKLFGKEV